MCGARSTANFHSKTIAAGVAAAIFYFAAGLACRGETAGINTATPMEAAQVAKPAPDTTGKERIGKASFYANFFSGRKMADGNIMDPRANNAASRTLPLGTIARVTNLESGKSAIVTIQDRGPYVHGRIVDLSPSTAQNIGISRAQGIATVAVAPITVPLPGGRVKLGSAATAENLKVASRAGKIKTASISRW